MVEMSVHERVAHVRQWVADYTSSPHPDLGRDGVVCPYMVTVLRNDHFTVLAFDAARGDDELVTMVRGLRDRMVIRTGHIGTDHIYLVSMIVLYGRPDPELSAMVERVHAAYKPEFVRKGFMLGDFWPWHEGSGLHSGGFRPFASPYPILGTRTMVPADLVFFTTPDIPPAQRLVYLGYYREALAGRLTGHWRRRLADSIAAARAALAVESLPVLARERVLVRESSP